MDKFILRTPRSLEDKKPTKLKESKLKQSTIKSLRRVVVIEDILHLKSSLEAHRNDINEDKLLEILEKLKSMNPSTKVLQDTCIGRSVNKLRNCEHQSVRELSRLIVKKWKKLVVEENTQKESIDVQCDAKTEMSRCKARKLICDSLNISLPDPWTEILEKTLFLECNKKISNQYKRSVRSVVFLLKNDDTMQENVKKGTTTPLEILSRCLQTKKKNDK
mgnify:FL=1